MERHSKEPWRIGRNGGPGGGAAIVTGDRETPLVPGANDDAYYGGYLVAESITPDNARRVVAAVNACAGIPIEQLERGAGDVRPLSDAEVAALSALYRGEVAEMETENEQRRQKDHAPAYSNFSTKTSERLHAELKRRGVLG